MAPLRGHRSAWVPLALVAATLGACGTVHPSTVLRTQGSEAVRPSTAVTAGTTFAGAGCAKLAGSITQTMSGAVSSCLRVGALTPGAYHVVLDQVPDRGGQAVLSKLAAIKGFRPSVPPAAPAVHLSLSPTSGEPGTTVTVTGTISSPLARELGPADLCWDGCRNGLPYSGVSLRWISPTSFETHLVVPGAPWIQGSPYRVAPLASGNYPIGVQCLDPVKGCGLGGSEGSASFHLVVPSPPGSPCGLAPCAHLVVTPGAALPGDVVKVTGFAPLESVIGSDHPFAFQLEVLPGRPSGPEVVFTAPHKGVVEAYMGHGALAVEAPPSWASLVATAPIAGVTAGLPAISADPSDPSVKAWCSGASVEVSSPHAQVRISTASAAGVLQHMGFGLLGGPAPGCVTATALGTVAGGAGGSGPVLVAAFVVAPDGQAPPTADAALLSADAGRTWTPVPVPAGASATTFGGFRNEGGALEALFAPSPLMANTAAPTVPRPLAEITTNAGQTWHSATLGCPGAGPCVSLGPYLPGNCAMNGTAQALLYSHDAGQRWAQPAWPSSVQACAPAELAATSSHTELLVDSQSAYPLRRSTDGGMTWSVVGLPPLPGAPQGFSPGPGPGGMVLLPGGSLLATGEGASASDTWELLRPGSGSWCDVGGLAAGVQRSSAFARLSLIGNQLWWLSGTGPSPSMARHVDAASLSCRASTPLG